MPTNNIGLNIQVITYNNIVLLDMTQSFTINNPNPYDPSNGNSFVITPGTGQLPFQITGNKMVANLGTGDQANMNISVGLYSSEGSDVITLQMTGQGIPIVKTIYGEAIYVPGTFNIYLLPASENAAKNLASLNDNGLKELAKPFEDAALKEE